MDTQAAEAGARTVDDTFEEFFEREYPTVVKFAYLLSGDRAAAEEIGQETMARVYERWERVSNMESPGGYASRVAVNLYRRRFRIPRRFQALGQAESARDPMDDVLTRTDLAAALRSLPVGQRAAVILVEWLGLDSSEAASVLGIRPASVRSRVHRGNTVLRKQLEVNHD
jgi:RNA polymerase sigma factor (sigma-70 family)